MAFDRPIEADRVDDLGLLSSFVRAPVVGTLMWIFGGSEARKMELEDEDCKPHQTTLLESVSEEEELEDVTDDKLENADQRRSSSMPLMTPIDSSENCNSQSSCSSPTRDESYRDRKVNCAASPVLRSRPRSRSFGGVGNTTENTFYRRSGSGRLKKRTSWSDEDGHRSLVEYFGESQSELHEPPSPPSDSHTSTKPASIKPAIRQSRSNLSSSVNRVTNDHSNLPVRSAVLGPAESTRRTPMHPSQCIPSGLGPNTAGNGGIIMPTGGGLGGPKRHTSTSGTSGGYVSPQWGWYISTTPPTPEMYNHSSGQPKKWLQTKSSVTPVDNSVSVTVHDHSAVQPVFTKGVKGVGRTPGLGWPSVPL